MHKFPYKLAFNDLSIEITRRCNLSCQHCMRGEAENLDMSNEVIDQLLDRTTEIGYLGFTGGEPLLNLDGIEYFLNKMKQNNIPLKKLEIVTNGTILSERFANILKDFYRWIDQHSDGNNYKVWIRLGVSRDDYHIAEGADAEKAVEFYRNRLKDLPNLAVVRHIAAENSIKPLGRAKNIKLIDDKYARLNNLVSLAASPRITRIEYLTENQPCFCALRSFDKVEKGVLRVLCLVEMTVYGAFISPYISEYYAEDSPENWIFTVNEPNIEKRIAEYNEGKPYCLEDDSLMKALSNDLVEILKYRIISEHLFENEEELAQTVSKVEELGKAWNDFIGGDWHNDPDEPEEIDFNVSEEEQERVYQDIIEYRKKLIDKKYPNRELSEKDYERELVKMLKETIDNMKKLAGLKTETSSDVFLQETAKTLNRVMPYIRSKQKPKQGLSTVDCFLQVFKNIGELMKK